MDKQNEKKSSYDQNPELVRRYRAGDAEAGEELVEKNLPLVYSIASRFRERGAEYDDLTECGTMGLVKAIKTFDTERGCAFSTYAVPLIFGEIRRFLRDDGFIKVSREEKKLSAMIVKERERRIDNGEPYDLKTVAASLGVSMQDAASALFSDSPVRSLDESVFDDDGRTTLGSTLYNEDEEIKNFDKLALHAAIEKLDGMRRKLIILRYFKDYSQVETARALGLSQVKVSREEKKIMAFLREQLE